MLALDDHDIAAQMKKNQEVTVLAYSVVKQQSPQHIQYRAVINITNSNHSCIKRWTIKSNTSMEELEFVRSPTSKSRCKCMHRCEQQ